MQLLVYLTHACEPGGAVPKPHISTLLTTSDAKALHFLFPTSRWSHIAHLRNIAAPLLYHEALRHRASPSTPAVHMSLLRLFTQKSWLPEAPI